MGGKGLIVFEGGIVSYCALSGAHHDFIVASSKFILAPKPGCLF